MPVSLYRFLNVKACSSSKSIVHIQFMKFLLVSSIILPMSHDEASRNGQGVGKKKHTRVSLLRSLSFNVSGAIAIQNGINL